MTAPIRDIHGDAIAAITIAAPACRVPDEQFEKIEVQVIQDTDQAETQFNR